MAALLLVGSTRSASIRMDDLQARSRRFLRRGLFVSGAIHLALLYAFLSLSGRGEEALPRVNMVPVDIIHPIPGLLPPPPDARQPSAAPRELTKNGIPEPTIDMPKTHVPLDFEAGTNDPGPTSGPGVRPGDPAPGPGPASGGPQIFNANEVEELPVPIEAPKPAYPDYAREINLTGRVVVKVLVDEEGVVRTTHLVSGIKILGDAAETGLKRWRFKPARMNGKAVPVWIEIPVNFVL